MFNVKIWLIILNCIILCTSVLINKCCSRDQYYKDVSIDNKCVSGSDGTDFDEIFDKGLFIGKKEDYVINYGIAPCDEGYNFYKIEKLELEPNGSIFSFHYFENNNNRNNNRFVNIGIFKTNNFCVEYDAKEGFLLMLCVCIMGKCKNNCCPTGWNMVLDKPHDAQNILFNCEYMDDYKNINSSFPRSFVIDNSIIHENAPECIGENFVLLRGDVILNTDGYISSVASRSLDIQKYCHGYTYNNLIQSWQEIALGCVFYSKPPIASIGKHWIMSALSLVGSLLLFVVAIVCYWMKNLSYLPSRMYICHSTILAIAFITSTLGQTYIKWELLILCVISGYIMQFSFLASFFWLNVMCFDMTRTFSRIKSSNIIPKGKNKKRFIYYSIYSWGGSLLLTIIAISIDFSSLVPKSSVFKPNIGQYSCWFRDIAALWTYFYGPITILLTNNIILFIYVCWKIITFQKENLTFRRKSFSKFGGSKKEQQNFILYFKLFSLMGVTWLTEVISGTVGGFDYIWILTDSINLLRAVFIFIIFCWKPTVWEEVKKRLPWMIIFERLYKKITCSTKKNKEENITTTSTNPSLDTLTIPNKIEVEILSYKKISFN